MLILNFCTQNTRCGKCDKDMTDHLKIINSGICKNFFHVKCSGTSKQVSKQELSEPWVFQQCSTLLHDNENTFAINCEKSQPSKRK